MSPASKRMLKSLKETHKSTGTLLPLLNRHVMRQSKHHKDDRAVCFHPSEMSKGDWCARRDFYRMTQPIEEKVEATNMRRENSYAFGHASHEKYQQWFWEMGILWGMFRCKTCDMRFFELSPKRCPQGHKKLEYVEVPLDDPMWSIEGHADAVLCIDGEWYIVEIKTIGLGTLVFEAPRLNQQYNEGSMTLDQVWFRIKRPFGSHLRQGMLYGYLIQQYELPISKVICLYEWKPNNEPKEFVLNYNPDRVADRIAAVREVYKARVHGRDPERPEWADLDQKPCTECAYKDVCWGVERAEEPTPVAVKRASRSRRKVLTRL